MKRLLLNLLSILSLLVCAAVVVLWVRSHRGAGEYTSIRFGGAPGRYTVRSAQGRLSLWAPPPAAGAGPAVALASQVRNHQLNWEVERPIDWRPSLWKKGRTAGPFEGSPNPTGGSPGEVLLRGHTFNNRGTPAFPREHVVYALCRALDDPDRFVVAHVLLTEIFEAWHHGWEERPDGSYVQTFNGLVAELPADSAQPVGTWNSYGDESEITAYAARVDPGQLPRIAEYWHRRLDTPVASAPYGAVIAALLSLPAAQAGAAWAVRWRRRRAGLCPSCGYDLRATPDRCPECGEDAQKWDAQKGDAQKGEGTHKKGTFTFTKNCECPLFGRAVGKRIGRGSTRIKTRKKKPFAPPRP